MAVLAPALRDKYGISLGQLGVVLASMSLGALLTLLPWGLLADRVGEGAVVAFGLGVSAAALVGAAFASGFGALACLLLLAGIGTASVQTGTGRAVMGWFRFSERGFALGLRHTAVPIGGAFAAVILPWVAASAGVRGALLVLAGAAAAAALLSLVALQQNPVSEPVLEVLSPLRNPRIWRISLASALFVCVQTALLSFTVLFLHDRHGLSTAAAAGVLAVGEGVGAALRLASGRWSDLRGDRVAPIRWLGLGVGLTVALAAAAANASVGVVVPVFIVACGLSMGWNALSFAAVAELGGAARSGAALGVQQTVLMVAVAATPLAFAPLVAATSWQLGFGVLIIFPAAALYVLREL
jgi:sugar phosphate permease